MNSAHTTTSQPLASTYVSVKATWKLVLKGRYYLNIFQYKSLCKLINIIHLYKKNSMHPTGHLMCYMTYVDTNFEIINFSVHFIVFISY